ncbi:MAG: 3-oxoacyl-[acyl-carrier-protein] reductase [Rhodospirillaceae bacterium]|nr:3-oxoacyl-[acyl-carrier-protein] reductase [Rhodospirillaceae bacterium]|tara:strand:- start:367 stop:1143 length:777 start_codon:yes stop_codon:yes gene_type:complete
MDIEGKRVIVTAGGGGIGSEVVRLFSDAGAKVFICDIDESALNSIISKYDNVSGLLADVSNPEEFSAFFGKADDYLGGLDIMVNNAGTAGPTALIEEISLDDWHKCIDTNLTSAFLGTQLAIPRIKTSDNMGGSIVNLSSAAGKFGFPLRSPYSAAKWAIVGLTRTTALEVGKYKIRCNCIQPGPVEGDRIDRVIKAKAKAEGVSENRKRDEIMSGTTLHTFIPQEHIAGMIFYLCSEAGRTITGQAISVDGGLESVL